MASQIIEIKLSIVELSQIVWKFKNVLHLCYLYGFIVVNYWWNSESVTQLIQKKISKHVTEMVRELNW